MKKRILNLVLVFSVMASFFIVLPVTSTAAESGQCGDNVYWTLNDGILRIDGIGQMWNFDISSAPWQ